MNVQPSLIPASSVSTIGSPTPRQLAFALAKLERKNYRRILPSEFMAYASKLPSSSMPNLSAAIGLSQLIGVWVQSHILNLDSDVIEAEVEEVEKRSAYKQFFIQTARVTSILLDLTSLFTFVCRNVKKSAISHRWVPLSGLWSRILSLASRRHTSTCQMRTSKNIKRWSNVSAHILAIAPTERCCRKVNQRANQRVVFRGMVRAPG